MSGATTPRGPLIQIRKAHKINVAQEGPDVVLLIDGRLVFRANWRQAEHVGRAILGACMKAKATEPRGT